MIWIHKRGELMNTRSFLCGKKLPYDESLLKNSIRTESHLGGLPTSYINCGFWISTICWTSSDIFSMNGGPFVCTED